MPCHTSKPHAKVRICISLGCACDKARYETVGHPQFTVVCHYRYCQLRTGSALGTLVCFLEENFKIISGKRGVYKFISESGYNWLNEF